MLRRGQKDKLAILLMPYFGKWPEWIGAYFESCRWNPEFDFLFFTDCGSPECSLPENVELTAMSLAGFNELYVSRFPTRRRLLTAYKLCDVRPAFGVIFGDYVADYPLFGWGDIDVVYGNLSEYLTPEMLRADVISFNRNHISGHLTLANTTCAHKLPDAFPNWHERVDRIESQRLDEPEKLLDLRVIARESFNTPLSPDKPWTDGRFVYPKEWYWKGGQLTNDLNGRRRFPYLHFMHWRGGTWPRHCGNAQWEALSRIMHVETDKLSSGFKINERGIFGLE